MTSLAKFAADVFRSVDNHDIAAVRDHIDPGCTFSAPGFSGDREAGLGFMQGFLNAFPDVRHEIGPVVESESGVAIELTAVGTHQGPLGELPATGKTMRLPACNVWNVRDGKITSYHVYFDQATLMQQLGVGQ